jgi:pimeloyl-ACP methyl ester carboxylesterase
VDPSRRAARRVAWHLASALSYPSLMRTVDHTYLTEHVIRLGRGEPLLLIHGLGHRKEGWEPLLPALAARFEVVAIDLPGFGGAPPLDVVNSDIALTDWCVAVLDELGWDTAHVAGNSLGGLIALRLAARGRARSVTALSPAGKAVGWEDPWARGLLRALRALAPVLGKVPAVTDTVAGRSAAMKVVFGHPASMSSGYARAALEGLTMATKFEETLEHMSSDVDLNPIRVPVTIAWGTRDVLLLPAQGRRWAESIPSSRLVRLPGLGHTPMPDDPDMVTDVIVRTAAA